MIARLIRATCTAAVAAAFVSGAAVAEPRAAASTDATAPARAERTPGQMMRERQQLPPHFTGRGAKPRQADDAASHAAQASDTIVDGATVNRRTQRTAAQMWRERQHLPYYKPDEAR